MSRLLLCQYDLDCGRMGDLEGLFITTEEQLKNCYEREVYWGEVLGKHSEIYHEFGDDNITIKTADQEFITKMIEVLNLTDSDCPTISGFNPVKRILEQIEEDGE